MPRRQERPTALLAALAAALAAALPPLYVWVVRRMLRRNLGRLWTGNPEPLLATYADDVRFVFPGRSSWAGDFRGKDEVRRWLERFVRVGLRFEVHEILVDGPPWDTGVCLWFTDRLTARKFFCDKCTCERRIFAERLGEVAWPFAARRRHQ